MIGLMLGALASSSARKQLVQLLSFTQVGAGAVSPSDATAEFRLNTNGDLEKRANGGSFSTINTWLLEGVAADYDVKFTITGETGSGLQAGSELQQSCGTNRSWVVTETTNGEAESSVTFTLELFFAGESQVLEVITGRTIRATVTAG